MHKSISSQFQSIADETAASHADWVDRGNWPLATMQAIQEAGLAGLLVPEHFGGLGQGAEALLRATEILGKRCSSTGLCFGMHSVGTAVIAANPSDEQANTYLRAIAAGQHITTLALSEPGTGSHFYLPECQAREEEDSILLNGNKAFVTNGSHADSYVISVMADTEQQDLSCLIVPNDQEGMHWQGQWEGLGMRGNSSIGLQLENVRVPKANLLGNEGDQIWYVFNVVAPYFLLAMTGVYLGIANAALEETEQHLNQRKHSTTDNTLSQNSVLQFQYAELWAKVERTRCLAHAAAQAFDSGDPNAITSVMTAKAEVADMVTNVVNDCMSLCGGIAYREGSKLHKLLRDARAAHVMSPTTNLLRIWVGRSLLGQPLLAD